MFCPRCGRAVNAEANFCGGCGLSRVEIEKYLTKTAPQQEAPKAEPAPQPEQPETEIPKVEIPQYDVPPAETVFAETEPAKSEEPSFAQSEAEKEKQSAYADNNCTYAYSYKKSETAAPQADSTAFGSSDAAFHAAQTQPQAEAPLSTVDYIWMFVISSLPVIGLIYIIYLAVQNNNINKRSFARAMLVMTLFAFVISLVFVVGVVAAGLLG
ncbi:MAG: hypothetical protein IKA10_05645 [Oscillospiraceae bacterium]|nr:hypothetical protein [Oscillospiraceae bacterium]